VTIGVTGATGGVGSRVVRHLLGRRHRVVALARRPDAVPEAPGLTTRFADYDDPESLRTGFAGLRTLVFVSSDDIAEDMLRHHEHVVAAAVDAEVEHVVYTSVLDASSDSGFYYAAVHRETEALLAASGLRRCLARTSIFSDYFLSTWFAPALETGELALAAGAGRMSLVTRDDTAHALAAAAGSGREGVLELTGPAALTAEEICRIGGILYRPVDDGEYRALLAAEGKPQWLVDAFATLFASVREGRYGVVSSDIPELTGERQRSFAEFVGLPGPGRGKVSSPESPGRAPKPSA
jgi:NAD(P)H dehydrogenase (quinone)